MIKVRKTWPLMSIYNIGLGIGGGMALGLGVIPKNHIHKFFEPKANFPNDLPSFTQKRPLVVF